MHAMCKMLKTTHEILMYVRIAFCRIGYWRK